jgi:glycosyltransferase involved in cell wall biosynthesis
MKKILYLISINGIYSPSTIVRAEIYLDEFKNDKNYAVKYFHLNSVFIDKLCFILRKNKITKPLSLPFIILNKIVSFFSKNIFLFLLKNYNAIIIIKYIEPEYLSKIRKIYRGLILFDFDDAIWLDSFGGYPRFKKLISSVDYVSCDNIYLLNEAKKFCNNCFILNGPAQVNIQVSNEVYKDESKIIIGWIGSQYTLFYLNLIVDVIEELSLLYNNLEFRICGIGRNYDYLPKFKSTKFSTLAYYDNKTMIKEISNFDIGVYPIDESELSLGRGSLKATLYMSCGIPVVASAIGHNCNIIKNGFNGFLANSKNEWFEYLNNLIINEHLRKNIGENGFNFVRNEYSIENCYSQLRNNFLINIK